ncbi:MAG TPA: amino acid ABC transporter permease [Planctomycetales bacterium]|nr:amino acid ABC transporter permease [Planctomycetales bacterium]
MRATMNRSYCSGVALLLALVGMTARAADRPLLWAADESGGAPYVFQDPNNAEQIVGFEVDLRDALQRELGRRIEFKHYDFKSLIPGLERGDFDFAMNGLEVLPEYEKEVLFSRPYYVYKLQLAVRKGERRFTTLAELKSLRMPVGTLSGSAAERSLMRAGVEPPALHSYDDQTGMYIDLSNGRVDAVYIDLPVHAYYLKRVPGLELVGRAGEKGYYAIAFRKSDTALADQFNAALGRLIDHDELRPIYQKWDVWNDDQRELSHPVDLPSSADAAQGESAGYYLGYLLKGAWVTIQLSVLGMLLAVALGMPIALMRLYGPAPVRWLAVVYVEFFRGIPVLLLLFFLYFVLGSALHVDAFTTAVVGFGLNYAAYEAEIYRAAIGAVPLGQWEAAASLGMSRALTFRRVILPQALRIILPPMTSDFVALFKDTSVVSVIAVAELTKRYQTAAQSSLKYVELGLMTAALYLIMSVPLGILSRWLEKRWGKGVS